MSLLVKIIQFSQPHLDCVNVLRDFSPIVGH